MEGNGHLLLDGSEANKASLKEKQVSDLSSENPSITSDDGENKSTSSKDDGDSDPSDPLAFLDYYLVQYKLARACKSARNHILNLSQYKNPTISQVRFEHHKQTETLNKLAEHTEDPRIQQVQQRLDYLFNTVFQELRSPETEVELSPEDDQPSIQQVTRKSSRTKVHTEKGEALAAATAAKKRVSEEKDRRKPKRKQMRLPLSSKAKATEKAIGNKQDLPLLGDLGLPPPNQEETTPDVTKTTGKCKSKAARKVKTKPVITKNGKLRRSVSTCPYSLKSVKDKTVRDKFKVCANHISELQYCNTFEEKAWRDYYPKSQHFMFTYDEMVQKPYKECGPPKRSNPLCIFLPPEGVGVKEFGNILQKVSKEMSKNTGKGYRMAKDKDDYFDLVFGGK